MQKIKALYQRAAKKNTIYKLEALQSSKTNIDSNNNREVSNNNSIYSLIKKALLKMYKHSLSNLENYN